MPELMMGRMSIDLVPSPEALPDVLPTERLLVNGMAIPELRKNYRHIENWRNVRAVTFVWLWTAALAYLGVRFGPFAALAVFILMGPMHARFAILMHESAHKLLFTNKRANDFVGKWFIAYPAMVPISIYRRAHFAHHKEEFGPEEPDMAFYSGYPCEPSDLRRRLLRDALGISGYKNFMSIVKATTKQQSRAIASSILAVQVVLFGLFWLGTGAWWSYLVFWWLPWMTQWRVLNRLRAIAEHGGMLKSDDRRLTTHNVRQHLLARFWFVPYNTGWHLAHHVDMGVPWHNLPAYHRELQAAGYVTADITFRGTEQHFAGKKTDDEVRRTLQALPVLFAAQLGQVCPHLRGVRFQKNRSLDFVGRTHRGQVRIERRFCVDDDGSAIWQLNHHVGALRRVHIVALHMFFHVEGTPLDHAGKFDTALQLQLTPIAARLGRSQRLHQLRGFHTQGFVCALDILDFGQHFRVGFAAFGFQLLGLGLQLAQRFTDR